MNPAEFDVKLFADGADREGILELSANPLIQGFTTNPTLMRKAGVEDYEWFARDILQTVPDRPFSLEVFADEHKEMEQQAVKISSWGEHVYVMIPVTNTKRESTGELLRRLSGDGVKVNVTAIMTDSLAALRDLPHVELIWASPRELLNIVQAHEIGCDIITVTHDLLKKLPTLGKDLDDFSLETVEMFHGDASSAGYSLGGATPTRDRRPYGRDGCAQS